MSNFIKVISKNANKVAKVTVANAPTILTITGVAGYGLAIVDAIKATPEAMKRNEEVEKNIPKDATKRQIIFEKTKKLAPVYSRSACLFTASTICVLGANHISTRRLAAVTTAYNLSEAAFKEYREKVVETFGDKKEQKVRDDIASDHLKDKEKHLSSEEQEIINAATGGSLFMDSLSRQMFRSTREDVMRALNKFERILYNQGEDFVDLNVWYDTLDEAAKAGHVEHIPIGNDVGFNTTSGIDIYFSVQEAYNGEPCTVIEYRVPPTYDIYM